MRIGDIEGLGVIYRPDGSLILESEEQVLIEQEETLFKIDQLILGGLFLKAPKEYVYQPGLSYLTITNKRILSVKGGTPDSKQALSAGFNIAGPIIRHHHEKRVQAMNMYIYQEVRWDEIDKIIMSSGGPKCYFSDNGRHLVVDMLLYFANYLTFIDVLPNLGISYEFDKWGEYTINKILKILKIGWTNDIQFEFSEIVPVISPITAFGGLYNKKTKQFLEPRAGQLYIHKDQVLFVMNYRESDDNVCIPPSKFIYFTFKVKDADKIKYRKFKNRIEFEFGKVRKHTTVAHFSYSDANKLLAKYLD